MMTNTNTNQTKQILHSLKPQPLWDIFENMCAIPRPSKHEEKIQKWVLAFAKTHNLEAIQDKAGNIIVKKPATKGMENLKGVVLQGHLDMVPQKNNDTKHDFVTDPIRPQIDGEWVKATGTTLGSDNGIGVAAALALLSSTTISHGPLEALFTFDEETGMTGAIELEPKLIQADILINLDSEDDGELFIGCAGGIDTVAELNYNTIKTPNAFIGLKISITGLKGGHSGVEIHLGRGNSNKIMNRLLWLAQKEFNFAIHELNGGTLRNAIPREATAIIAIDPSQKDSFIKFTNQFLKTVQSELSATDPNVNITTTDIVTPENVIEKSTQEKFLNSIYACPNGVFRMSADFPGLVETSNNLAIINMKNGLIKIETLQRSSIDTQKDDIKDSVASSFLLMGANVKHSGSYPGWKPNPKSEILDIVKSVFKSMRGHDPKVLAIHAGLECGLLGTKYPNWDMISFGPTIRGAHSPDEKVNIKAVEFFWDFLLEVLKHVPKK